MQYSMPVYVALFGWPFGSAILAFFFPIRRVILFAIVGGNILLPQAVLELDGLPSYTRSLSGGLGALFAALLVALPQLISWRLRPVDLCFFAFLLAPGFSSLLNNLGPYDAFSTVVNRFLEWGVAYWVGRSLFDGEGAMRDLGVGIVMGGMIYAPLCIWESVMSPQLHVQIYGFRASPWIMALRFGGYRPTVFMQHGLAVGVWMASSSVVAWVLWRSGVLVRICYIPMMWIAVGLVLVTISLRSAGAALLLFGMIGAVEFVQFSRLRVALLALLLLPAGYIGVRVAGWEGRELVDLAAAAFGEERAGSLNMRLENDTLIVKRAMEQPLFGWGGWGRWRVFDEFGRDITVSDSWWGILVGTTGVFGLVAAYGTFMGPMFLLIRQRSRKRVFEGSTGAAWAVGMAILLFVFDTLVNAMPNTVFMLAAGAMASFVVRKPQRGTARTAQANLKEGPGEDTVQSVSARPSPRTIDLR